MRGTIAAVALLAATVCRPSVSTAQPFRDNTRLHLTVAGVRLGETTFVDVQDRLGPAELRQRGDGGDYVVSLCYQGSFAGVVTLTLVSGPIGAGRVITSFVLASGASLSCAVPTNPSELSTASGLRIGMHRDATERVLGPPTSREEFWTEYSYGVRQGNFDITSTLRLRFQHDRLVEARGSYLETN